MRHPARVTIQTEAFDTGAEIDRLRGTDGGIGAIVAFVGTVRDREAGGPPSISTLELEHYPGMTERSIEAMVDAAFERFPLRAVRVIHRVGPLAPHEGIVLVLAASSHRGEAFQACEFLMDYLKTQAPFWKKEHGPDGARWVDARVADDAALARWGLAFDNAQPADGAGATTAAQGSPDGRPEASRGFVAGDPLAPLEADLAQRTLSLRQALGRYTTGVAIVTCRDPQGQPWGLTVNSFASLSLDPPLVLWSLRLPSPSLAGFEAAGRFAVNVLAASERELSRRFASKADDKFAVGAWADGQLGTPVLADGAVAVFECRTVATHRHGDHLLFIGQVEHLAKPTDAPPLVFRAGLYHALGPLLEFGVKA